MTATTAETYALAAQSIKGRAKTLRDAAAILETSADFIAGIPTESPLVTTASDELRTIHAILNTTMQNLGMSGLSDLRCKFLLLERFGD